MQEGQVPVLALGWKGESVAGERGAVSGWLGSWVSMNWSMLFVSRLHLDAEIARG